MLSIKINHFVVCVKVSVMNCIGSAAHQSRARTLDRRTLRITTIRNETWFQVVLSLYGSKMFSRTDLGHLEKVPFRPISISNEPVNIPGHLFYFNITCRDRSIPAKGEYKQ